MKFYRAISILYLFAIGSMIANGEVDKESYTQKYAKKLHELFPQMEVTIVADLELNIKIEPNYEVRQWLDNSFAEYSASPGAFESIVRRFGTAALPRDEKQINTQRIVPIVKDKMWRIETDAATLKSLGKKAETYVVEELSDDLEILYAQDLTDRIVYLKEDELKKSGLSQDTLRKVSMDNLGNILEKIEKRTIDGVNHYSAGGTYESSLILFPWMWNKENFGLDGDVVFAIPTRDVLLATTVKNKDGIERIRESVKRVLSDNSKYKLTDRLFRISDGRIIPYSE